MSGERGRIKRQDSAGPEITPSRARAIQDRTGRGERMRMLVQLATAQSRAVAARTHFGQVVQGRFFDSLGDPITGGELDQIRLLLNEALNMDLREKWNTERASAREANIWRWFHNVGLYPALGEGLRADIESIIGRETSHAAENKKIKTPEERRMDNIDARIKAREQQVAKEDNSGHGKHYKGLLRGGTKGDRHQTGQDRKANRLKYLRALIGRMEADKAALAEGGSEEKSIQDLLHAPNVDRAREVYYEVMGHESFSPEVTPKTIEFCQLLYHVGIIDEDVPPEAEGYQVKAAVEAFFERLPDGED